jgi:hypothetical protein
MISLSNAFKYTQCGDDADVGSGGRRDDVVVGNSGNRRRLDDDSTLLRKRENGGRQARSLAGIAEQAGSRVALFCFVLRRVVSQSTGDD